jgi:hypothetical protein
MFRPCFPGADARASHFLRFREQDDGMPGKSLPGRARRRGNGLMQKRWRVVRKMRAGRSNVA